MPADIELEELEAVFATRDAHEAEEAIRWALSEEKTLITHATTDAAQISSARASNAPGRRDRGVSWAVLHPSVARARTTRRLRVRSTARRDFRRKGNLAGAAAAAPASK